jgi:Flp pilus assembly protein TadD
MLLDHFQPLPERYRAGLSAEAVARIEQGREGLRDALRASVLRARGDMRGSIRMLRAAVELAPSNPIVRNELSESLVQSAGMARTPAARIELCEEALRVNPMDFWAIYHLIQECEASNQSDRADAYLESALVNHPESPLLLALRGKRAALNGDVEAACGDMQRVVEKMPRSPEFWRDYAIILKMAERHDEAATALARAEQLDDP